MERHADVRLGGARWYGLAAVTLLWFDVVLYSSTVVVMGEIFLPGSDPAWARAVALSSVGVTVIFRPVGGWVGGWLVDRWGRRPVALLAVAAGSATTLVAFLPPFESVGAVAPLGVVAVRALQGLAVGAIWPSFIVWVVESAPDGRRCTDGAWCQAGVPAGLLLSQGAVWVAQSVVPGPAYAAWGFRLPSLLALMLGALALWSLRSGWPPESPVLERLRREGRECRRPLSHVLRTSWAQVVGIATLTVIGNMMAVIMFGGFIPTFVEGVDASLEWVDGQLAVGFGAAVWLGMVVVAGPVADRLGRAGCCSSPSSSSRPAPCPSSISWSRPRCSPSTRRWCCLAWATAWAPPRGRRLWSATLPPRSAERGLGWPPGSGRSRAS